MENYSHHSHPNSGDSSPLSRDIDCENSPSCDDYGAGSYKVKFMCSYGGKIQPRPHDNQLSYVAGNTKILSLDRNSKFPAVLAKLASLCDASPSDLTFKYQLPGEDLDALISVTNDDDLEHMMLEYDRLNRSSSKPARLRIFLFPLNQKRNSEEYRLKEPKPEGNSFVDAFNSALIRPLDVSSPPAPAILEPANPDFLLGFDKAMNHNLADQKLDGASIPDLNDKVAAGVPVGSVQSQRFRIGKGEMHKSSQNSNPNENTANVDPSERHKGREKVVPVSMPTNFLPERQVAASNYPFSGGVPSDQQPVYILQNPSGVYHQTPSVRPATGLPPCQGYYSVSPMMPDVYHEQPMYGAASMPRNVTAMQEGIGVIRQPPPSPGMVAEQGYAPLSYDGAGRRVYFAASGGGLPPRHPHPVVTTATAAAAVVEGRGVGVAGPDSVVISGK